MSYTTQLKESMHIRYKKWNENMTQNKINKRSWLQFMLLQENSLGVLDVFTDIRSALNTYVLQLSTFYDKNFIYRFHIDILLGTALHEGSTKSAGYKKTLFHWYCPSRQVTLITDDKNSGLRRTVTLNVSLPLRHTLVRLFVVNRVHQDHPLGYAEFSWRRITSVNMLNSMLQSSWTAVDNLGNSQSERCGTE